MTCEFYQYRERGCFEKCKQCTGEEKQEDCYFERNPNKRKYFNIWEKQQKNLELKSDYGGIELFK